MDKIVSILYAVIVIDAIQLLAVIFIHKKQIYQNKLFYELRLEEVRTAKRDRAQYVLAEEAYNRGLKDGEKRALSKSEAKVDGLPTS